MLRRAKRPKAFEDNENVNPMNYLSNLSDAMLVLAVGMMLALVVAWNVDIVNQTPNSAPSDAQEMTQNINSAYLTDDGETALEESGLKEYGMVYVDENGNFYVVEREATP